MSYSKRKYINSSSSVSSVRPISVPSLDKNHVTGVSNIPNIGPSQGRRFTKTVNGEILVYKGQTGDGEHISIDLNDLRTKLTEMRRISDRPIKKLHGTEADTYRKFIRYANLLYNTDAYKDYYNEIHHVFKDIDHVEPGTVGGYFAGCLMKGDLPDTMLPGCSILCAGSMQPSKSDQYQCQYPVVWAHPENGKYQFSLLSTPSSSSSSSNKSSSSYSADDSRKIVLYLASDQNFKGLSEDEKLKLLQVVHYNADKRGEPLVNVVKYSKNGQSYQQLLGGFVPLSKIPNRSGFLDGTSSGSGNWLLLIIFVIIVIIVLAILWKLYSDHKKKKEQNQTVLTASSPLP